MISNGIMIWKLYIWTYIDWPFAQDQHNTKSAKGSIMDQGEALEVFLTKEPLAVDGC